MTTNSDTLFFDDDLLCADEKKEEIQIPGKDWKVMIIDDEPDMHHITKLVLGNFKYEGKGLEFISGYSGEEARQLIRKHPDVAIIFLDVVMEEDDAGLQVVKYIREELKNNLVRIILRTGQPGLAPEERIILDYDINAYREKTELTSQKLFSEVVASLRAYDHIKTIDTNRKGLEKIIDSFANIFELKTRKEFATGVLRQLTAILSPDEDSGADGTSGFVALKDKESFYILSATGKYREAADNEIKDTLSDAVIVDLQEAYRDKKNIFYEDRFIIYVKSNAGSDSLVYLEGCKNLSELDKNLINVFFTNVRAVNEALVNFDRYDSERKRRNLSEILRNLNRKLTATFDSFKIMQILVESLAEVIDCDRIWAALKQSDSFEIFKKRADGQLQADIELPWDSCEYAVIFEVGDSGMPLLISDISRDTVYHDKYCFEEGTESILAVPVIYGNNLFGIVILESKSANRFSAQERDLAVVFASQAGVSVENARLVENLMLRNAAVKNLLDNAGQGFLSFGAGLLIDKQYSLECEKIFGKRIDAICFPELFFTDTEEQNFWKGVFDTIFRESDDSRREIVFSLLFKEAVLNNRYISLDYKTFKIADSLKIMVILTDVTEKRHLESQMEKERKILKMVVNVVVNYDDFSSAVKDFTDFCSMQIFDLLDCGADSQCVLFELFRAFHTYKGVFGQLGMVHIFDKLHELESYLSEIKERAHMLTENELRDFLEDFNIMQWLEEDLRILGDMLGESFINRDKVLTISEIKLLEIEDRLKVLLTAEQCSQILPEISRLRYKPIRALLEPYCDYVIRMAERLKKLVKPFKIEGGDILVDTEKYGPVVKAMLQIFKNIADHGLETVEERLEAGKEENGTVRCSIETRGEQIHIFISDDGRGIDPYTVRDVAIQKCIYSPKALARLSDEEVIYLIFEDEFTTRKDVTDISGRGFGLAAVKTEVEKLDGTIDVISKDGQGTAFYVTLPVLE